LPYSREFIFPPLATLNQALQGTVQCRRSGVLEIIYSRMAFTCKSGSKNSPVSEGVTWSTVERCHPGWEIVGEI